MTKQTEVRNKAEALIQLIKTRFVRLDGLLARNYPSTDRTLFDNFDDLVPFFIYFGEEDFLLSQIYIIRRQGESMLTLCSNNEGVLLSRNLDEWFGGWYALWRATGDKECFALLSESVNFVGEHLIQGNFLSGAIQSRNRKVAPYYEPWSSGLLEVFCEMRAEFPEAFQKAQAIMRSWVDDDYFRQYSLFPYRVYRSPVWHVPQKWIISRSASASYSSEPMAIDLKWTLRQHGVRGTLRLARQRLRFWMTSGWYSQLMKSNSTSAFTLLEFFLASEDHFWLETLSRWCDSALEAFVDAGRVFMEFYPVTGMKRAASVTPAFILVDVLCDAAWYVPEFRRHLPKIREILDYQWADRLPNGMVPWQDHGNFAHIDSQVDFSITLRRYAELSTQSSYLDKSIKLMEDALLVHYSPEGYLTFSGEVTRNAIDPKYNALLLKGMIHLLTIDQPLYPKLRNLFKDR